MSDPTCEEKIDEHLSAELAEIREALSDKDGYEEYRRNVLSVDRHESVYYDVLLSWGGPSDGFRIHVDSDGDICKIEYYFKDWFDGASRELTGDEFETVAEMFGHVVET